MVPLVASDDSTEGFVFPRDGTPVQFKVQEEGEWDVWRGLWFRNARKSTNGQYPIVVILRTPPTRRVRREEDLHEGLWKVKMTLSDKNLLLKTELQIFQHLSEGNRPGFSNDMNLFCLDEIMLSRMADSPKRKSPNFFAMLSKKYPAEQAMKREKILKGQADRFNKEARTVFTNCMLGVPGNIIMVSGCPGVGKTTLLAAIVMCLVLSGQKVLVTSSSNTAVDTIVVKLLDTLNHLSDITIAAEIRESITHVYSAAIEARIEARLEARIWAVRLEEEEETIVELDTKLERHSLSGKANAYCETHPEETIGKHYLEHRRCGTLNTDLIESVLSHY